jgi:GNAT superfamily N-acetyltransferase
MIRDLWLNPESAPRTCKARWASPGRESRLGASWRAVATLAREGAAAHHRAQEAHMEWTDGNLLVSDDKSRLQIEVIQGYLERSYWARGIPRETVARSIENSRICLGLFDGDAQVGFARLVTDEATYAYLCDVFVLESHQGRGLAVWLLRCVHTHPGLRGIRRWALVTRDAHGLYERFGWRPLADPRTHMEIHDPRIYARRPT